MILYEPIARLRLAGVIDLCKAEGWASYTEDVETTWKALVAPGVITIVAVEGEDVLGVAQMLTDGHIQAHLSLILVGPAHRRKGIAKRLVEEAFARSGAKRLDLVTDSADEFYRSFKHHEWSGYRIYPGQ